MVSLLITIPASDIASSQKELNKKASKTGGILRVLKRGDQLNTLFPAEIARILLFGGSVPVLMCAEAG
jgi:hypothetical protein